MVTTRSTSLDSSAGGEGPSPLANGTFLLLRLYRIARQIDLGHAQTLPSMAVRRRPLPSGPQATSIQIAQPPLRIDLGERRLRIGAHTLHGAMRATVYDLGVVALRLECTLSEPTSWDDIAELFHAGSALAPDDEGLFDEALQGLEQALAPALVGVRRSAIVEDYSVLVVDRALSDAQVAELRNHPLVLAAVLGEQRALSADATSLVSSMSYYPNDAALLSWNGVLLIDPDASSVAVELIEFAEVELLMLRAYDADLDASMPDMYQRIARADRRFALPVLRSYGGLLHEVHRQIAEVTDITERLDNALKVTDDVYWNRLYSAMLAVLRVDVWRNGVEHKLALLRQTYELLRDEAEAERGTVLEVTVVLLIVLEVLLAIVKP